MHSLRCIQNERVDLDIFFDHKLKYVSFRNHREESVERAFGPFRVALRSSGGAQEFQEFGGLQGSVKMVEYHFSYLVVESIRENLSVL